MNHNNLRWILDFGLRPSEICFAFHRAGILARPGLRLVEPAPRRARHCLAIMLLLVLFLHASLSFTVSGVTRSGPGILDFGILDCRFGFCLLCFVFFLHFNFQRLGLPPRLFVDTVTSIRTNQSSIVNLQYQILPPFLLCYPVAFCKV